MTDAEKYVTVFRAAAKGLMAPFNTSWPLAPMLQSGTGVLTPGPSEAEKHASSMAGAFMAIADVFQGIVNTESE